MSGEFGRALNHAYRLLGYRQRSERELSERLRKKGFGKKTVEEVLVRLRELGYVDDGEFARTLRRKAEGEKLLGAAGARRYLRRMGIPADTAGEALEGYDEAEAAGRLVRKKLGSMRGVPETARKRRLAGYLKRRGYSTRTVLRALRADTEEEA
jgi:regulatory protein